MEFGIHADSPFLVLCVERKLDPGSSSVTTYADFTPLLPPSAFSISKVGN